MPRLVALLCVPLLLLPLAACADEPRHRQGAFDPVPAAPEDAFEQRAVALARAWRAAVGDAWRKGFVPLQELTVLPDGSAFTGATKQAVLAGWYEMRAAMPREAPGRKGTVEFPDGATLTVPLVTLAEAYGELDQGDPPPCTDPSVPPPPDAPPADVADPDSPVSDAATGPCTGLTVTAVRLGTVDLRTSRGEARVPAWLFTVRELAGPVARVAVAPSAIRPVPAVPADALPADTVHPVEGLVGAQDLTVVEDTRLSYRLGVGACDEEIQPLWYETDDVVVVAGTATRADGTCTEQLLLHPVRVTLDAPVAARPVLDGATGRVLTYAAG